MTQYDLLEQYLESRDYDSELASEIESHKKDISDSMLKASSALKHLCSAMLFGDAIEDPLNIELGYEYQKMFENFCEELSAKMADDARAIQNTDWEDMAYEAEQDARFEREHQDFESWRVKT